MSILPSLEELSIVDRKPININNTGYVIVYLEEGQSILIIREDLKDVRVDVEYYMHLYNNNTMQKDIDHLIDMEALI